MVSSRCSSPVEIGFIIMDKKNLQPKQKAPVVRPTTITLPQLSEEQLTAGMGAAASGIVAASRRSGGVAASGIVAAASRRSGGVAASGIVAASRRDRGGGSVCVYRGGGSVCVGGVPFPSTAMTASNVPIIPPTIQNGQNSFSNSQVARFADRN